MSLRKQANADADELLKRLQKNLDPLVKDADLEGLNPFDIDTYNSCEFSSKRNVQYFFDALIAYFRVAEGWNLESTHGMDFMGMASAMYMTSRSQPHVRLTHQLMRGVGGYLESDWLVFVPFTSTSDSFKSRNSYNRPYALGDNSWVLPIWSAVKTSYWVQNNSPISPMRHLSPIDERAHLFHHQLCQIGAAKYDGDITKGHFFVFRCKGSLRALEAKIDPSKYFALFIHGKMSIESNGKTIFDKPFFSSVKNRVWGLVGVNLKDQNAQRFKRHTSSELRVRLTGKRLAGIRKARFSEIVEMLFRDDIGQGWSELKICADLLYQFIENENFESNGYTQDILSTVLLCSAGEALLRIGQKQKKRSFSTMIALFNCNWRVDEFSENKNFLDSCYKVRSNFVHDGTIEIADNSRLFKLIFVAWRTLAVSMLDVPEGKYSPADILKNKAPKQSALYRMAFMEDIL